MRKFLVAAAIAALFAAGAQAQVNTGDLKWGPAPAVFPKGAQMVVLAGDPSKPGTFVIR
jgi:hypothetical protein